MSTLGLTLKCTETDDISSLQASVNHAAGVLQGKVSILAHSLGSVLCYEILCNQPHLFDHLEFNMHGTHAPSDTTRSGVALFKSQHSTASEVRQQQQPLQQQIHQASTEIAFAPMSSRDLEDSCQTANSCPDFPMPSANAPPNTVVKLGGKAEVRLASLSLRSIRKKEHEETCFLDF